VNDFQAGMPGRLRALPLGSKILYSAFVVATLVGLAVSARLYQVGVGDAGAAVYYAGAASAPPPAPESSDGPAIDLAPEDQKPRTIHEQIPERKLLEVTHFHLFTIPVYVLVLAHLWLLAKVPPWAQNTGVVASVITSGLHLAAPWIVRGRPGLAFLMGSSGAAMLAALGVIAVGSMIDMWLPNPPPPPAPGHADRLAELRARKAAAAAAASRAGGGGDAA
jgi:hypothetical protein